MLPPFGLQILTRHFTKAHAVEAPPRKHLGLSLQFQIWKLKAILRQNPSWAFIGVSNFEITIRFQSTLKLKQVLSQASWMLHFTRKSIGNAFESYVSSLDTWMREPEISGLVGMACKGAKAIQDCRLLWWAAHAISSFGCCLKMVKLHYMHAMSGIWVALVVLSYFSASGSSGLRYSTYKVCTYCRSATIAGILAIGERIAFVPYMDLGLHFQIWVCSCLFWVYFGVANYFIVCWILRVPGMHTTGGTCIDTLEVHLYWRIFKFVKIS